MTEEHPIALVVERHWPSAELRRVERLAGGVSADVYRLDLMLANGHNARIVLRVHGTGFSRHDAELEFRLLQSLHLSGLRVPKPMAFDASCKIMERPYLLIDFIQGSSQIRQSGIEACIRKMAFALIEIHTADINTLPDLPSRIDPLPELLDFLPDGSARSALRNTLTKLNDTAFNGSNVLLHGDFWPENLLWRDNEIVAILDWEDAAIGDPLSDVACTCLELRYRFGTPGMNLFKQTYSARAEIDPHRFALWQAYVSAAAQKYMSDWGLEPKREDHMRKTALASLREAVASL